MLVVDGAGIPLTTVTESAQKSEVKLALDTVDSVSVDRRPLHPKKRPDILVADKGYDAQWLRDALTRRHIRSKIPKRRKQGEKDEPIYNETIKPYYRTRWIVERTIAWFGCYRRVLTRWERNEHIYQGFINIASTLICLKRF